MRTLTTFFTVAFTLLAQPVHGDIVPELSAIYKRGCIHALKGSWVPIPGTDKGDCDVGERLVVNLFDAYIEEYGVKQCPKEFIYYHVDIDRTYCVEEDLTHQRALEKQQLERLRNHERKQERLRKDDESTSRKYVKPYCKSQNSINPSQNINYCVASFTGAIILRPSKPNASNFKFSNSFKCIYSAMPRLVRDLERVWVAQRGNPHRPLSNG